ncbi:uncharacterized protein LOC117578885 isoform X1 [Drosophila guanche]|uniref:Uncharacterized protein n=1 Tax=Drosophila guanche TaxID=7266 RepID=A0A3B0J1W8_DROGU|nr:uncharacterized protein LOC117578885 isoform X1 [Drosophila guanche]SPP75005.1 Hypothetical predicted protein [Drosophila guanche]
MAPAINSTITPPMANLTSTTRSLNNATLATTPAGWTNGYTAAWDGPYVYYYPNYVMYITLVFLFVFLLPLVVIMSAMKRKREAQVRALALQRQRARREMEISVTNNNINGGSATAAGISSVSVGDQSDQITVLPKTLDLPPSYDEAAYLEHKQGVSNAASTLTIATNLEVGINEPPPVYEAGAVATTTTTTTTTFRVNGQPPVM